MFGSQAANQYFALNHSLGYVNTTYGRPLDIPMNYTGIPVPNDPSINARTLALGARGIPANPNDRMGIESRPFPWLTWNDRPFVSEYELLQVPISAPGRLTVEHSTRLGADGLDIYDPQGRVTNPYFVGAGANAGWRYTNTNATFGHLLNFFATTAAQNVNAAGDARGPEFYRLLEYAGVPSRFVGTEMFLNPFVFQKQLPGTELRRPPFNRISMYREPGQINLNTIFSEKVYYGLMHGAPNQAAGTSTVHPGPSWAQFAINRRGYATNPGEEQYAGSIFAFNDNFPTFFAGLYGPPDAGTLVPLPGLPQSGADMRRSGADMGLLRAGRDASNQVASIDPLFREYINNAPESNVNRNPYFRYQPMQRLANLTTTRSNVYAVWITVGFFETEPVPPTHRAAVIASAATPAEGQLLFNRLYPEGMWLGQEFGSDTGQTERFRGFYMIDRSIPVAFEPGQNHNVDRAILVRRRIE
jgi:hypothetical protein